jgi:hypothetical protein
MSTPYNRNIQAITIHHMGDGLSPGVSILKRWNPYRYEYPEYDFGIEFDGTVRTGRPLTVQGAHCIADKPTYSKRGYQWWNRNSIGIGLAGDFTKYPMPVAQYDALVSLVRRLMHEHNLTLDHVYPHGQVAYTACPGCTYSKVPGLKGSWSYDDFEKDVMAEGKDVDQVMQEAVVYWTLKDFSNAEMIAAKRGNCGMFCRNANPALHPDAVAAKHLVVVGGPEVKDHPNVKNLCGLHAEDTAILAAEYAKTL